MSPIAEPTVLDLHAYSLRHIGPKALLYPDTPGQTYTVLNAKTLIARPLPSANIPNSPDFVQGTWTGRVFDAGDGNLIFPNKEASDGQPWRNRFDPTGKLQWIEVWVDEYLEAVLCITKVTPDRNQVKVEGYDGFQLSKSAYVRDWTVVAAPRDVIDHGTQLWQQVVADSFPLGLTKSGSVYTTPFGTWTDISSGGTTAVGANGGITFSTPASTSVFAKIGTSFIPIGSTFTWAAQCSLAAGNFGASGASVFVLEVDIVDSASVTKTYYVNAGGGYAAMGRGDITGPVSTTALPSGPQDNVSLRLECDGEWVFGYANGALVGAMRTATTLPAAQILLQLYALTAASSPAAGSCTLVNASLETLQPFLMRGADKGDYVLPGSASTYPTGGLHARYYNDADLAGDPNRMIRYLNPGRSAAYGGSGVPEYANQQDATIAAQQNPLPGAATSNWSVKWFGAIWLPLASHPGNYTFTFDLPVNPLLGGVRLWIGKTKWGDQIVDAWNATTPPSIASPQAVTVNLTSLNGTLAYATTSGDVPRDGWYPIRIEYMVDSVARAAPTFSITTPSTYTDPGGTSLSSGVKTTVPATSLSPLGCVDQRFQATSHFDLVQKTSVGFGYQFSVEPKQLESGLFPGVLAPRLDEGTNYDVVIEPDDAQRKEGMLNYAAITDGTDQAASLFGNGAGFQNGTTGQLQAYVFDPATLAVSMFDMQGWQDAADASYPALLAVTLNSELGLRLTPWSLVSGDPMGRMRQSYTWPLPGTLQQFRWRPGDAVRLLALDINIQDTVPRSMLLVTRNIHPNGTVSTQVGFAARPKTGVYANRKALAAALRPQRNYQRQLVTLTAPFVTSSILAGALTSTISGLALLPGDVIKSVRLRITANSANQPIQVLVNGVNDTAGANLLKAPAAGFVIVPVNADITTLAVSASGGAHPNSLGVVLMNNGGSTTIVDFQLFADVLR